MTRKSFNKLFTILKKDVSKFSEDEQEEEGKQHKSGRATMAATKLAVFLTMMAGGSAEDISHLD